MPKPSGQFPLILASASPRRQQFLQRLGIAFEPLPADVDEAVLPGESPEAYVTRVAVAKACHVHAAHPHRTVLAADTSVVLDNEILGKPADPAQARQMLQRLSGVEHRVLTAIALQGPVQLVEVVSTTVRFRVLGADEIDWYVASGEPFDKAGGYGIQGLAGMFVVSIDGSASNVVGLPLAETVQLLARAGHLLPWSHS
jgi:septum formation protein